MLRLVERLDHHMHRVSAHPKSLQIRNEISVLKSISQGHKNIVTLWGKLPRSPTPSSEGAVTDPRYTSMQTTLRRRTTVRTPTPFFLTPTHSGRQLFRSV